MHPLAELAVRRTEMRQQGVSPLAQALAGDPLGFYERALGAKLYAKQQAMVRAVHEHRRVSVSGCNSSGKDHASGRIVLDWLNRYTPSKVVIIGPTSRQVKSVVWAETRDAFNRALVPLPGRMLPVAAEYYLGDQHFALGFATDEPYNVQGFHCLTPDHEVLTKRGFVPIQEVCHSDQVLSLHTVENRARWSPVEAIQSYDVQNQHINVYDGKQVSFAVTDEHRFLTKTRPGRRRWAYRPFDDLPAQFMVRRLNDWKSTVTHRLRGTRLPKVAVDLGFCPEEWASFLGWWIAEGSLAEQKHQRQVNGRIYKRSKFYEVVVWQTKIAGRDALRSLLVPHGFHEKNEYFVISNHRLADWLRKNCGRYSPERRIPPVLKDAKTPILTALLDGLIAGDGHSGAGTRGDVVWTTSKTLADDIQEISIKIGRPGTIGLNATTKPLGLTRRTCYSVSMPLRGKDHLVRKSHVKRVVYSGTVYCLTTRDGNFLTRRNGRVHWSGNSENLLCILTEAHAIPQAHIDAVKRLNPRCILMTGNPLASEGEFYESHHERRDDWHTIEISAFDTPNVVEGRTVIPGLVTLEDIEERRRDWGEENPLYIASILGQFPANLSQGVVTLEAVKAAIALELEATTTGVLALDVGGGEDGGDKTVLAARFGPVVKILYKAQGENTRQTTHRVFHSWYQPLANRITHVIVDGNGIGAGVVDGLRELGVPVVNFNAGSRSESVRYANRGAEVWGRLANAISKGQVQLPEDRALTGQLVGRKFQLAPSGKLGLESKQRMAASGRRSPDEADAVAMTYAVGDAIGLDTMTEPSRWASMLGQEERHVYQDRPGEAIAEVGAFLVPLSDEPSKWRRF